MNNKTEEEQLCRALEVHWQVSVEMKETDPFKPK